MVPFILVAVFAVPLLIFLFAEFTRNGSDKTRNRPVYWFGAALSAFGFLANIVFDISDGLALTVLVILTSLFALYMLAEIIRDKRKKQA